MNVLYRINAIFETKVMFFLKNGYRLNINNPVTFNEKLQWIKFYDKNEKMPTCSDKYTVREYIKNCGCEEILNHLIWEGYEASEIPFDSLPNQFVIKVTHGSGFNILCKDKSKLIEVKVKKQLARWLKEKYVPCYGEWFYGIVKPRIIIEEYLGNKDGVVPNDYKVYCFNGEPKVIQVHTGRFSNHRIMLYDLDWNTIDNVKMKYSYDPQCILKKPQELYKLIEYAKKISQPFHHARVDFYIVEGKIYFGEITFTDGAGFDRITPYSFDAQLGNYMELPINVINKNRVPK